MSAIAPINQFLLHFASAPITAQTVGRFREHEPIAAIGTEGFAAQRPRPLALAELRSTAQAVLADALTRGQAGPGAVTFESAAVGESFPALAATGLGVNFGFTLDSVSAGASGLPGTAAAAVPALIDEGILLRFASELRAAEAQLPPAPGSQIPVAAFTPEETALLNVMAPDGASASEFDAVLAARLLETNPNATAAVTVDGSSNLDDLPPFAPPREGPPEFVPGEPPEAVAPPEDARAARLALEVPEPAEAAGAEVEPAVPERLTAEAALRLVNRAVAEQLGLPVPLAEGRFEPLEITPGAEAIALPAVVAPPALEPAAEARATPAPVLNFDDFSLQAAAQGKIFNPLSGALIPLPDFGRVRFPGPQGPPQLVGGPAVRPAGQQRTPELELARTLGMVPPQAPMGINFETALETQIRGQSLRPASSSRSTVAGRRALEQFRLSEGLKSPVSYVPGGTLDTSA